MFPAFETLDSTSWRDRTIMCLRYVGLMWPLFLIGHLCLVEYGKLLVENGHKWDGLWQSFEEKENLPVMTDPG